MTVDLLTLIGKDTQLKRVASTYGGEYAGPCPFCKGTDRFRVWPNHGSGKPRWWCRRCDRKGDTIDYVRERYDLDYYEALRFLEIPYSTASTTAGLKKRLLQPAIRGVVPPPIDWQNRARSHIERAVKTLWVEDGAKALNYLHKRGLTDETIRRFKLGYIPLPMFEDPVTWGLDDGKKIHLSQGIVIPHLVGDLIWGLKIRLLSPKVWQGKSLKYSSPRGSTLCLYNASGLQYTDRTLLLAEGEFDTMIAWQELREIIDVASLCGASKGNNGIPGRWLIYLLGYKKIPIAYDSDEAGQNGAGKLAELSSRFFVVKVPSGGDLNGYFTQGGDLRAWMIAHLSGYK